eukprot:TRINITY_DN15686_c1_g1_i2.p1 TRINITY_DN15686_c1_g1~~TRINITY_DN15686_c1_g1_i2.p1  ORF type:complete len:323 (+),score=32.87 TRINITY_DN15686_c1_g1_i2:53-1021(+)
MKKQVTLHITVSGRKYCSVIEIDYAEGELSASGIAEGLVKVIAGLRDVPLRIHCGGEEVSGSLPCPMLETSGVVVVAKIKSQIDTMDIKLLGIIFTYLGYHDSLLCRVTSRRMSAAFSDWAPHLSVKHKHLPTDSISNLLWNGLRKLDVSNTDIDDSLWSTLSTNCLQLMNLNLSWCHKACDLSSLKLPRLKKLQINGCYRLHALPSIRDVPLLESVSAHVGALSLCTQAYPEVQYRSFVNVYVTSVCRQILIKKLSLAATTFDLMKKVQALTGIPPEKQTIVFRGSICNPSDVLLEKGITDCSTVFLSFPIVSIDCVEKKF